MLKETAARSAAAVAQARSSRAPAGALVAEPEPAVALVVVVDRLAVAAALQASHLRVSASKTPLETPTRAKPRRVWPSIPRVRLPRSIPTVTIRQSRDSSPILVGVVVPWAPMYLTLAARTTRSRCRATFPITRIWVLAVALVSCPSRNAVSMTCRELLRTPKSSLSKPIMRRSRSSSRLLMNRSLISSMLRTLTAHLDARRVAIQRNRRRSRCLCNSSRCPSSSSNYNRILKSILRSKRLRPR